MARVSVNAWRFAYATALPPELMASLDAERRAKRLREAWQTDVHRLVAVAPNGTLVGFAIEHRPCSLPGFDAEIGAIYIEPASTRAGIGRRLVEELVRRFLADGHHSMAIQTLAENPIGNAFYQKLGGVPGPAGTWQGLASNWYLWTDLPAWI
jgi:GNAT superfamily N-acetyltransferase